MSNPFIPTALISRRVELQHISQILQQDGDFLVVGAPGTGRHTLIRAAAQQVGARMIEIDCLRSTSANRFLRLLADGFTEAFPQPKELARIEEWSGDHALFLEHLGANHRPRLTWQGAAGKEWGLFQTLLALPQRMAEWLDCRVVIVFQNFPHIRSWDRSGKWEHYLRQEVQRQSRVSYALVTTVAEPWVQDSHHLQVIPLAPLEDSDLEPWIVAAMADVGFEFDRESQALAAFLGYVQGHLGDAIALAQRIWLDHRHLAPSPVVIRADDIHHSITHLVDDLALTFESLILLLPPSQVRVLESLALDPTDKPHARDYIEKHQLSRGGGLQGALTSLEHKGLVYGPKYGYKIAMPFLAFWLRQRLA